LDEHGYASLRGASARRKDNRRATRGHVGRNEEVNLLQAGNEPWGLSRKKQCRRFTRSGFIASLRAKR